MSDRGVIAITGASGFIGTQLSAALLARGWRIRALVRNTLSAANPGGPEYRPWELGTPAAEALAGVDVLIHAAAVPYDRPEAHDLNIEGSRRLRDDARAERVARLVFISSMSARHNTPSAYGRDKASIAELFDGPSDLVVRPGLVLGDGGLFGRLAQTVSGARIVPLVGGGQRFQTIHVDDLGAAVAEAIDRGLSGTITIAEPEPVKFADLLREVARLLDRHPVFVPVPYAGVAIALGVAGRLGVRLPVSRDNLEGLRALRTQDVRPDLARIGLQPRDYRASLTAVVRDT